MTKKEIIDIISSMEERIGDNNLNSLFVSESRNDNKKIGCNQFRDIAGLCREAECCEEIEMLIRYNMAKCIKDASWMATCRNNARFGDIILDDISKIKDKDEHNALSNLELSFGYLYWQARIWTVQAGSEYSDR